MKKQVTGEDAAAESPDLRRAWFAPASDSGWQLDPAHARKVLYAGCLLALLAVAGWFARQWLLQAEAFRLPSHAEWLTVEGGGSRDLSEVAALFEPDQGQSLASVDIAERRRQVLSIPWVGEARVAKIWPDRVRVFVRERVPLALVLIAGGEAVRMIAADGVLLPYHSEYGEGLPVLTGIDAGMDLQARRVRAEFFSAVMDACRVRRFSESVSEVNVADLENAVVLAKHDGRLVRLELGHEHLRHRVEIFLDGVDSWRSALGPVKSANLRLEGQIPVVLDLTRSSKL